MPATTKLFEAREKVETKIMKRIDELHGRKGQLTVAQSFELKADVFEHIKAHEKGQDTGLDSELHALLTEYCGFTRRIYGGAPVALRS